MKNKTFSLYLATILFRIVQHYIDGVFISSLSGKLAHFPRALGHILCSSSGEEPAAAATSDPEVELARKWEKSSQRTTQKSGRGNKRRLSKCTFSTAESANSDLATPTSYDNCSTYGKLLSVVSECTLYVCSVLRKDIFWYTIVKLGFGPIFCLNLAAAAGKWKHFHLCFRR